MTAPATESLLSLKTQLETITSANGYATELSAVAIGRDALAVGSQAGWPVITLTTLTDEPANGTVEAGLWVQTWTRTVALEILAFSATAWETDLDAIIDDVRRALARFPRPLELGAVRFTPPADGGSIASAVLQLSYRYIADYSI